MTSSIKITSLTDIGANISTTSLVPVVDMSGVPETKKANLQIVGNLILNGANGSTFPPAAQAILAQSVTNAAQPNITSVGTLSALNVSGNVTTGNLVAGNIVGTLTGSATTAGTVTSNAQPNITSVGTLTGLSVNGITNLGPVGNVKIEGGSAGQILTTDGAGNLSWGPDANSSYGNADVANYLPTFTGELSAGNANLGNAVVANYLIGDGSLITGLPAAYGNADVANYLPTFTGELSAGNANLGDTVTANFFTGTLTTGAQPNITSVGTLSDLTMAGNIIPDANVTYDLGNSTNRWKDLYLAGNTIVLGDAILSANANAFIIQTPDGGNFVLEGNTNTTFGNIVGVNLDGNVGNVLAGDGTWIAAGGGGSGNIGNLEVTGTTIGIAVSATETTLGMGNSFAGLEITPDNGNPIVKLYANTNSSEFFNESGGGYDTGTWIAGGAGGVITLTDATNVENFFNTLGGPSTIVSITINGTDTIPYEGGGYGGGTVTLNTTTPPAADPTNVSSIVFNIVYENKFLLDQDDGTFGIYIGNENFDIESQRDINLNSGDDIRIRSNDILALSTNGTEIRLETNYNANTQSLIFNTDGNLSIPGVIQATNIGNITAINLDGNVANVLAGDGTWIAAGSGSTYGDSNVTTLLSNLGSNAITTTANVTAGFFVGDGSALSNVTVSVAGNIVGTSPNVTLTANTQSWTFDNTGNLTLAGNTRAIYFANGALAFGNVSGLNLDGNSANVLLGNGVFAAPSFTLTGDGGNLSNIQGANVVGTVANANYSSSVAVESVSDDFSYHLILSKGAGDKTLHVDSLDNLQFNPNSGTMTLTRVDADYVLADLSFANGYQASNVVGLGNIATLNTNGNASSVLLGNGTFGAVPGLGNVGATNFDGNSGNVLYGNGVFAVAPTTSAAGNINEIQFNSGGAFAASSNLSYVNGVDGGMIELGSTSALQLIGNGTVQNPAGNIVVTANNSTWRFDDTGNLTIPGSSGGLIKTVANSSIGIVAIDNGTNNPAQLMLWNQANVNPDTIISAYATNAAIQTNVSGTINTWSFDNTGNLSVPGNILVSGIASPAPYISGFSSITTIDGANLAGVTFANGNITANNIGNIAATNYDGSSSNVLYGNGVFAAPPAASVPLFVIANANITASINTSYQIDNSVANANINFTLPDGDGLSTGSFVKINPYDQSGGNFQYFVVTNGANSSGIQGLVAPLSANTPTTLVWGGSFWYYSN